MRWPWRVQTCASRACAGGVRVLCYEFYVTGDAEKKKEIDEKKEGEASPSTVMKHEEDGAFYGLLIGFRLGLV
jgi:hypothetical protein